MFDGHRIVCVTPAGRRRYLEILAPQILASPLVDAYHLWRNTVDAADVAFLEELRERDPRVRIVEPTLEAPGTTFAIGQFYRHCIDPDTIYVRFDDDVVFVEPAFFEKFLRFRVDHPQYLLVYPNTINNAVCTYIQAARGAIQPGASLQPWCMDVTAWANPRFAEQLHRAFLASVAEGDLSRWYFGAHVTALTRYSINCMAWFGREFARFGGVVHRDEEEYVSVIKPMELGMTNCIDGDVLIAHFAFMPQRAYLDATDLCDRYAAAAAARTTLAASATAVPSKPASTPSRGRPGPVADLWTPRLLEAVEHLRAASEDELATPTFVADRIRHAGLVLDRRFPYGRDNRYMNTEQVGLWHVPQQLARFLVALRTYQLTSVLECGTDNGWTACLVAAYLSRFNPDLQLITIDTRERCTGARAAMKRLGIEYRPGQTAKDYEERAFDLVILDANHAYEACRQDYDAVGRHASVCAMHDVNDKFVSAHPGNHGGVPRLWEEIKTQTKEPDAIQEFLDHPSGERVMGIGSIVRASARARRGS